MGYYGFYEQARLGKIFRQGIRHTRQAPRSWPSQTLLVFLSPHVESASPHEVKLVEATIDSSFTQYAPDRLIGDKAYDSDGLDTQLYKERRIELIAPHRRKRKRPPTQDGRKLRRYSRRWKVERLFAWMQNFRRLVVRYEYHVENFLALVQLGFSVICFVY